MTGAVVVVYLADGRLTLPKNATVFNVGDAEVTEAQVTTGDDARAGAAWDVACCSNTCCRGACVCEAWCYGVDTIAGCCFLGEGLAQGVGDEGLAVEVMGGVECFVAGVFLRGDGGVQFAGGDLVGGGVDETEFAGG